MKDFPISKRLQLHALWLSSSGSEGMRIELSDEDMRGAKMQNAILIGAKLSGVDFRREP